MGEQLVEVPTELSFFSQFVEQNAHIPVLGARVVLGYGGVLGFFPVQSSHPSDEQTVDIPVPGRGGSGSGGLQGFHPRQSLQRQIVDIPVGGGPQDFLPDPGLTALSAVSCEEPGQGFFSHFFPSEKSVEVAGQLGARVHGRSSSSTLSSHQMARPSTGVACEFVHFEFADCWCGAALLPVAS